MSEVFLAQAEQLAGAGKTPVYVAINGKPVTVTVGQREQDAEAFVSVRDQGMGVKPQDQERIFEQFERADGPAKVAGLAKIAPVRVVSVEGTAIENRRGRATDVEPAKLDCDGQ